MKIFISFSLFMVTTIAIISCSTQSTTTSSRTKATDNEKRHSLEAQLDANGGVDAKKETALIQVLTSNILNSITNQRDAHPKAHGCVENVDINISPNLAKEYQQGIFATPNARYKGVVRFSSGSSDPKVHDATPGSQGLALKILLPENLQKLIPDIPGEKYKLPKNYYKSADIIMINAIEEFMVNDVGSYPAFFKAVQMIKPAVGKAIQSGASKEDIAKIPGKIFFKEYISTLKPDLQAPVGRLLQVSGSSKTDNVLAETYNSWVPYAFGPKKAVKYRLTPCIKAQLVPSDAEKRDPNFLANGLQKELSGTGSYCFELQAIFHEPGMPSIEDAALPWELEDGTKPEYKTLAIVSLPKNSFAKNETCEAMSFNPSHALPSMRGIGGIQRARKLIYAATQNKRNGLSEEK